MSAATQNEMDRLRRVNAEYEALLQPLWEYVDQQGLAKLGESRVAAITRSHASLNKQLDEALTREAALAACLERIVDAWMYEDTGIHDNHGHGVMLPTARYQGVNQAIMDSRLKGVSLKRRDLIKQAEGAQLVSEDATMRLERAKAVCLKFNKAVYQQCIYSADRVAADLLQKAQETER